MSTSSRAFERSDRAQVLLEEFEQRRAEGETTSLEALIAAHPELEVELRELAAACGEVEEGFCAQAEAARRGRQEVQLLLSEVSAGAGFTGRYVIEGEVGQGGMGAVLRVRDRKLDRSLAMKVILGQADARQSGETPPVSPHQLKRFLNEAKITGQLDHPGIVPVHEVGVDERGRAYFTMKLVQGQTLAAVFELHARKDARWSTPRVLGVIQRVCEALAFAHDRGIIHRDLKPANVMVGEFGEVYVMDWGLARRVAATEAEGEEQGAASDEELVAELTLTRQGKIVGTPCYMSPEQARGDIARMGPWSDVYAIGAMLYELVAGAPPYTRAGEHVSSDEILARIEVGPPEPVRSQRLAPELAAILEKAMSYETAWRYPLVRQLAEDLERFVAGRTVRALKVGAWVELEKWVKRNKALASTIAGTMLLLIVGLSATLVLLARLEERNRDMEAANLMISKRGADLAKAIEAEQANAREAQARREEAEMAKAEALAEKDRAKQSAEETQLVADFQSKMLSSLSVDELGRTIIVELQKDLVDNSIRIGRSPQQIEQSRTMLETSLQVGNPTNVAQRVLQRSIFEPAMQTIEQEYQGKDLLAAMLLSPMAEVLNELSLYELGESAARLSVAARRAGLGNENVDTLTSINSLASLLQAQGKLAEAEPLYREALAGLRGKSGDEHLDTLTSINNLASVLQAQGKLAEAEPLYREALAGRRAKLGDEHPSTLTLINNLASLLQAQGKLAEAEPLYREALAGRRAKLGDEHLDTLTSINNLGFLLQAQGKLAEAEPLYREAVALLRVKLGDEHPNTLFSINNLATVLKAQGNLAEAQSLYWEALAGLRAKLGDEHPNTLRAIGNLASLLQAQGTFAEAELLCREALAGFRAKLGEHPDTLTSINNLASLLQAQGELAEAELLYREALAGRRAKFGNEHPSTLTSINNLAFVLQAQGELVEAEPLYREALAGVRAKFGPGHLDALTSASHLATLLQATDNLAEAELLLREALLDGRATLGNEHPLTQGIQRKLIYLYRQLHEQHPNGAYDQRAAELEARSKL